mgnify:CR=1 FL=1|jgi:hypothetical protein
MSLNREAFLRPAEVPVELVEIPELGGSIKVRGMTARQRSEFEKQFQTASGKQSKTRIAEVRERLVVACCVNDDGSLMFSEEDISAIGNQAAGVVERIVNVAQRLCGMSNTDVEELAKN